MRIEDRRVFGIDSVDEVRGFAERDPERLDRSLGAKHIPSGILRSEVGVDVEVRPALERVVHRTDERRVSGTGRTRPHRPHDRR